MSEMLKSNKNVNFEDFSEATALPKRVNKTHNYVINGKENLVSAEVLNIYDD